MDENTTLMPEEVTATGTVITEIVRICYTIRRVVQTTENEALTIVPTSFIKRNVVAGSGTNNRGIQNNIVL